MCRPSCPPRSQHAYRPSSRAEGPRCSKAAITALHVQEKLKPVAILNVPHSPSPSRELLMTRLISVFAVLAALICVAPAFAQSLPAGLDPQNTLLVET